MLHEFQGDRPFDPKLCYSSGHSNFIINGEEPEFDYHTPEIESFRILSGHWGFQLIGADLSLKRAFSIPFQHPDEVHRFREFEGMARTMVEYSGKSSRPIVTIIGAYHSHPASEIHPILERNGIEYCVIQQVETERAPKVDNFGQKLYL